MTDLKDAITQLITMPIERQKRQDELLEKIFNLRTKFDGKEEIVAFFKLVGPQVHKLSNQSIETLMRLVYYLELDADIVAKGEADRDIAWNKEIALFLLRKQREAYAVLGTPEKEISPGELMHQKDALNAYAKVEEIEMKKDSSYYDELRNRVR